MSNKLTLKQQLFCDHYLSGKVSATEAVVRAGYNISKKKGKPDRLLARNIASENLAKPGIAKYIGTKLETVGLNDQNIQIQHAILINQFHDLPVKLRAIDMYYRLKGSYAPTKPVEAPQDIVVKLVNYAGTIQRDK